MKDSVSRDIAKTMAKDLRRLSQLFSGNITALVAPIFVRLLEFSSGDHDYHVLRQRELRELRKRIEFATDSYIEVFVECLDERTKELDAAIAKSKKETDDG